MAELAPHDLRHVAQRLPRDIRDLLKKHAQDLYVGGGFIRATIAGETPSDIDLFGDKKDRLEVIADDLAASRPGSKVHKTKNAITVLTPDRLPVQFITRWTFDNARKLVDSFDFTVCQAAVHRCRGGHNEWASCIGERFYQDLAARRLHYTNPVREEEAGGSMLRVIKYVKRGYSIQVGSLGAVIARLTEAMRDTRFADHAPATVLSGLLREGYMSLGAFGTAPMYVDKLDWYGEEKSDV